jgi:hypothetical protein
MESRKAEIRAARPEDFASIGADTFGHDAAAYVLECGGKLIGIAGICFDEPAQAFSILRPECDRFPKQKIRIFNLLYAMMMEHGGPIYAVASPHHRTAPGLLEHYFFERVGDHEEGQGLYVWAK